MAIYSDLIRKLKGSNTVFGDRISGTIQPLEVLENTNLPLPYLMVVPQSPAINYPNDNLLEITHNFALVAILDGGTKDNLAHAVAETLQGVRDDLFRAILNWDPDKDCYEEFRLSNYQLENFDGKRVEVSFEFNVKEYIDVKQSGVTTEDQDRWDGQCPAYVQDVGFLVNSKCKSEVCDEQK